MILSPDFAAKLFLAAVFFVFLMVVDELFGQIDNKGGLKDVTYCWPIKFGCVGIWTAWEAVFIILSACFLLVVFL